MALIKITSIKNLTLVTCLTVALIASQINANLRPTTSSNNPKEPSVYFIQHSNNQLGQQQLDRHQQKWNNQKLIAGNYNNNNQEQQALVSDSERIVSSVVNNNNNNRQRTAKQLVYTDEPLPYYHSYKYMGFGGGGGGAFAEAADYLHYHSPSNLRGSNSQHQIEQSYPAAYDNHQQQQHLSTGYAPQSTRGAKPHQPRNQSRGKPSTRTNGTKSVATNSRRRFESPLVPTTVIESAADHGHGAGERRKSSSSSSKKNLVCYYGTWAVYRPDAGKFAVENIDPFLCTHIIYGFTGLSYDNLIKPLDPWNDLEDNYGKGAMKRFTNLKRINPDLKTLVAIGGWNEGSIKYSKMASEPEARAKFVKSAVDFLEKYNFDGLDLDWEYPGSRGGHSYDKANFVKLLRELHQEFSKRQFLLTAAVSAGKWFIDPAYDIPEVSKYLDLINLMAYDYHGGWESKTGMNAPLFHSSKHDLSREDLMLNVNWSVNYWLQMGAKAEKIMLGVGSYGRSFTLDREQETGINAPASQKGRAGPYTREPGSLGYNEICESFQKQPKQWTIVRDPDYLAPYAYNNERQWVGYDDVESLALKAQFAKSMGLGGMMMWSIETDDFLGRCHNGEKFPLLNTIKRVLGDGEISAGKPATTSTTTFKPPTSPPSTSRTPWLSTTSAPLGWSSTTPGHEIEEDELPPHSSTTTTRRPPAPTTARTTTTTRRPGPVATSSKRPKATTTTTLRPPTTQPQQPAAGEFVCRRDGMFADPRNCRKFVRCVSSGGSYSSSGSFYSLYKFDCGPGTAFNEQHQYCDHIYNVPNCNHQQRLRSSVEGEAGGEQQQVGRHPSNNYHQQYYGSSSSSSRNNYLLIQHPAKSALVSQVLANGGYWRA